MRVAIIGGGASGMTAAHLLGGLHDVTLYEQAPVLGGHVRTLGLNVEPDVALGDHVLDAGVIEFERRSFPTFVRLMEELGVETAPVPATTTLFLADGRRLLSPAGLLSTADGLPAHVTTVAHGPGLALGRRRFERLADRARSEQLLRCDLAAYLDDSALALWLRLLAMYAYSTPFEAIDALPAALAVPMLRDFLADNRWFRICGGVYRWFDAALARFDGRLVTGARIRRVRRSPREVVLELEGGAIERVDQVVFAATPDVPLRLLEDPTDAERRRFGAWRAREVEVLVHHDEGPYERRGVEHKTEFDVFARARRSRRGCPGRSRACAYDRARRGRSARRSPPRAARGGAGTG